MTLNTEEKQELKALSKELLGSESAFNRIKKGISIRETNPDGSKAYTKAGLPIYRMVSRTEKQILEELRAIKKARAQKKLKDISGSVSAKV